MNIKARLGEQLRRTTLSAEDQTYSALKSRLAVLFARPSLNQASTIKYRDDEGDWIDMSSNEELLIALSLARQQSAPLQLLVEESKESTEQKQELNFERDIINPIADQLTGLAQHWAPLIERITNVAAENGISVDNILNELASVEFRRDEAPKHEEKAPEQPAQEKPVHRAWCDKCNQQIAGLRFKCLVCPDYDLCETCETTRDVTHPTHDFLVINRPGPCPRPHVPSNEVVHWASCDNCQDQIRGLRFKCTTCPDYDLCNTCMNNGQAIHSEHKFNLIEKSVCPWRSAQPQQEVKVEEPVKIEEPVEVAEVKPAEPEPQVEAPVEVAEVPAEPEAVVQEQPAEPLPVDMQAMTVEKLQSGLKQLEEMGFTNREENIRLIIKNKGDIVNTIVELLE